MKPAELTDVDIVFPANVTHLLPEFESLPQVFQDEEDPWCAVAEEWFYRGADANKFVPKPGIDKTAALRHLQACLGSYQPKHEHKMAGVGYLMSLWFEPISEGEKP